MRQISATAAGDLIVTAVEGGFGRDWWDARKYRWRDVAPGKLVASVELRERQEDGTFGPWLKLDRDAVQRGLELIVESGRVSLSASYLGQIALYAATDGEEGDVDSIGADAIAQAALLGDIIYG